MPIDILMPQLSPTMTEGRLAKWTAKVGENIRAGQVIAEVETDKATMEIEASDDGVMHMIVGEVGADIAVGVPIAVLRGAKEVVAEGYKPKVKEGQRSEAKGQSAVAPVVAPTPVPAGEKIPAFVGTTNRVKASPLARRLAAQQGVNLAGVMGSGPRGRVVAKDVQGGCGGGLYALRMAAPAVVRGGDSSQRLSPMRKAIAARLTAAKQTVPHFYLKMTADVRRLMYLREDLNGAYAAKGVKLSLNDFIIKACALALRDKPAANASFAGDSLVQYGNVDISVAVAIEGGLITPIVFNADQKPLAMLSAEMKQLAADAKAGKLKPEQYEGGGFSISNLGMYGIEEFAAIVNPPQAAILAVGKASEDGKLVLTLSVDHRVIDGALGAELLGSIKEYLEKPSLMM
ncbi:MAG: dihydrolipoamide acetyltransferase family protein [Alphaproteobacteria bacterium]